MAVELYPYTAVIDSTAPRSPGNIIYWDSPGIIGSDDLFKFDKTTKFVGIGRAPNYLLDVYSDVTIFSGGTTAAAAITRQSRITQNQVVGSNYGLYLIHNFNAQSFTSAADHAGIAVAESITGTVSGLTSGIVVGLQYSGTITSGAAFRAGGPLLSGSVSNYSGFHAEDIQYAATIAAGFRSNVSAGTGKYGMYAGGTAQHYFNGNVGIKIAVPTVALDVVGAIKSTLGVNVTNAATIGVQSSVVSGASKWNIYADGTAINYFAGNVGIGTSSPGYPFVVATPQNIAAASSVSAIISSVGATVTFLGNQATSDVIGSQTTLTVAQSTFTSSVINASVNGVSTYITSSGTGALNSIAGMRSLVQLNSACTVTDVALYLAVSYGHAGGGAVTNYHGFLCRDLSPLGTNVYGVRSQVSTGTNKWNIYADGTAANYMAGALGIGVSPTNTLDVNGTVYARQSLTCARGSWYSDWTGNDAVGMRMLVAEAGGTNRWNIYADGTAPSYILGKVGIGAYPSGSNQVTIGTGNLYCLLSAYKPGGGPFLDSNSSRDFKQNIRPMMGALDQMLKLRPRWWEWRQERTELEAILPGRQAGFVIEEMQEDMPEWVTSGATPDSYALSERGATAYLVSALQELKAMMDAFNVRLTALET